MRPSLPDGAGLPLFRAISRPLRLRDVQDLMAYPFFSLSKSRRVEPIIFQTGSLSIQVEATRDRGMATIWDADILIWAASQIVEARDHGLETSRRMAATPYEILTFIGRGTSTRDYQRLRAALDRLKATTIFTSIRQESRERLHRFSWINEWSERRADDGSSDGIELIVPDWFYQATLDESLILTIDPAYFGLKGGVERWLYRVVRKHAGRQRDGWSFSFRHLHEKSGSHAPYKRFAYELRRILCAQSLPGYQLSAEMDLQGESWLGFMPHSACGQVCGYTCGQGVDSDVLSGTRPIVLSGTQLSCYQEPESHITPCNKRHNWPLNLTNIESNLFDVGLDDPTSPADKQGGSAASGVPHEAASGSANRSSGQQP